MLNITYLKVHFTSLIASADLDLFIFPTETHLYNLFSLHIFLKLSTAHQWDPPHSLQLCSGELLTSNLLLTANVCTC